MSLSAECNCFQEIGFTAEGFQSVELSTALPVQRGSTYITTAGAAFSSSDAGSRGRPCADVYV